MTWELTFGERERDHDPAIIIIIGRWTVTKVGAKLLGIPINYLWVYWNIVCIIVFYYFIDWIIFSKSLFQFIGKFIWIFIIFSSVEVIIFYWFPDTTQFIFIYYFCNAIWFVNLIIFFRIFSKSFVHFRRFICDYFLQFYCILFLRHSFWIILINL